MRRPRIKMLAASLAVVATLGVAVACGSDDGSDAETAAATTAAPATTEAAPATTASAEDALFADVPEVPGGTQAGRESIQEGGVHVSGMVSGTPADTVAAYSTALGTNGWTIDGSGGDPTGELGAGVQATAADGRYLSLNLGADGGTTFSDLCVWPTTPSDTDCGSDDDDQD